MIGRQLPVFSMIVPFWLIVAFAGWRGTLQIWPAILVAGVTFAIPQFLVSNFHGPWLVDVVASLVSMGSLRLFLKCWQPVTIWTTLDRHAVAAHSVGAAATGRSDRRAAKAEPPAGSGAARLVALDHPERDRFRVGAAGRSDIP